MVPLAAAFATAFVAGAAGAATVELKATLDGATEVPAVAGSGKGTATLTVDTTTGKVAYTVEYSGLSGPATMAHIHGPAAPGSNAGVVAPLTSTASPLKGEVTLNEAAVADLLAGKDYINVHTAAHPSGEIRGWITK
jgi:hypothetical protein